MTIDPRFIRALEPRQRLIVALDTPSLPEALNLVRRLEGSIGLVKIGLELFVSEGPAAVAAVKQAGVPVFLDLKLHDIPNTVRAAARQAARLGVSMMTVHALGGPAMLEAAVLGAMEGTDPSTGQPPVVLAVTVLTSMDEGMLAEVGIPSAPPEQVARLARVASCCGVGGFVCSPHEANIVRAEVGERAVIVTPGVRRAGGERHDQARVDSPAAALAAGADYLVVGRPITQASDPRAEALAIAAELAVPAVDSGLC